MPRIAQSRFPAAHEELLAYGDAEASQASQPWFVYLFALSDCSAFKVGFSCNPLHRIYSFSRRYFEQFDLSQSRLLRVGACDDARAIEAALKTELAQFRAACPAWVPFEAGGHTEWFSAVYFGDAEARLQSFAQVYDAAQLISASEFILGELARLTSSFERWAWGQAQQVCDAWSFANRGYTASDASRSLRDWLDAYRFFDIPLFADDPSVLEFVSKSARLRVDG
ncbi:MAG: GIY-YIG nuclease family protein [Steroidobacter sp.]